MIFGPNMQNFQAIAAAFVEAGAAVQVPDAAALEQAVGELLADPNRCEALGHNAIKVVRSNQGSIDRTVEMIVRHLHGGEMYVAPRPEGD
jgi:3-deoxy-D-manno-octulosonic-acid transferase